jgi:hypothetical protein
VKVGKREGIKRGRWREIVKDKKEKVGKEKGRVSKREVEKAKK